MLHSWSTWMPPSSTGPMLKPKRHLLVQGQDLRVLVGSDSDGNRGHDTVSSSTLYSSGQGAPLCSQEIVRRSKRRRAPAGHRPEVAAVKTSSLDTLRPSCTLQNFKPQAPLLCRTHLQSRRAHTDRGGAQSLGDTAGQRRPSSDCQRAVRGCQRSGWSQAEQPAADDGGVRPGGARAPLLCGQPRRQAIVAQAGRSERRWCSLRRARACL